jgi:bifunctional non-homologous end joining protein LigD
VVALDDNGAPDFAALQNALSEGRSQNLTYLVFDLLFADDQDLRTATLVKRKAQLDQLISGQTVHKNSIRYLEHVSQLVMLFCSPHAVLSWKA